MSKRILNRGDTINIKRTNGVIHTAIVASIEYDLKCVKVEWFENGDTKGKEIYFANVTLLNPDVSLAEPIVGESDDSLTDKRREESRRDALARGGDRSQSARPRPTRSAVNNSDSNSEHLRIDGKSISSARTTRSVIETASKCKDADATLKRVSKLEKERLARRKKQAEQRAEKDEFLRRNQNNPHWELTKMIQEFRREIEFKPLTNQDHIEDHLITVAVRKRPLNEAERDKKEIDIITVPSKNQIIVHEPKHKVDLTKYLENHMFRFDYALNENCSNEIVYKYTAQPLVKTLFQGGFATCFAYGQTGSGKTYTMSGTFDTVNSERGVYALAATDIFKTINAPQYRRQNFTVSCSFFEIYVKKVFDLLNNKQPLKILEDGQQQVQIVGLTEQQVTSVDDVLDLIYQGNEERASGQTSANLQSSRSHAVFQFYLRTQSSPNTIYGKFSLIDLAGNERGADTFSSSKTTRLEGAEINQSLLSLKECIRTLGRKGAHLPFRGSKLTQVLRDSFVGAHSKTCMIAMISPGIGSCENTLNTLRYADRVKELGGGDVSIQRLQSGVNKDDLTSFFGTQSVISSLKTVAEPARAKKEDKVGKELVATLQKYIERVSSLSKDNTEAYYCHLNEVINEAISSLINIQNLIIY